MDDLVLVRTYPSRFEAEIGRGLLESNNIKAMITADDAGGMYTQPLTISPLGVQLLVHKEDLPKAKKLLNST